MMHLLTQEFLFLQNTKLFFLSFFFTSPKTMLCCMSHVQVLLFFNKAQQELGEEGKTCRHSSLSPIKHFNPSIFGGLAILIMALILSVLDSIP